MSKNWIEHNNNPKRRDTGDCVTRAIAKVLRKTWSDTYMELAVNATVTGMPHEYMSNYGLYLTTEHDYVKIPMQGSKMTVNQLACLQVPYLASDPRWVAVIDKHATAVVRGKIYDTWDCSRRQLKTIFVPKKDEQLVKREIIAHCKKKGINISWKK